jgi:hypothetical protein
LNTTVPFQIDGWFLVNDKQEVSQYELTFRHFAWAIEELTPYVHLDVIWMTRLIRLSALTPLMAEELGSTSTNNTEVLQQAMITSTCLQAVSACTGDNAVYQSFADCTAQSSAKSLGAWDRLAGTQFSTAEILASVIDNRQMTVSCVELLPLNSWCTTLIYIAQNSRRLANLSA